MKKYRLYIVVAIVILALIFIVSKFLFNEGDKGVSYEIVEQDQIPQKLMEILPKYKTEERALTCKLEDGVYVVVTRGEKKTAGYSVNIKKLELKEKEEEKTLVVYAEYRDPKPDEVVAQIITYPMIVVKTELEELPNKVELKVEYLD
ncbi:protease complex subunit PrcB family protein [Clostridiisalibacter paucivorans]|uniref:protease complex subunit PrcB family protein n=1 Tax=Clostridiisalibacter paucivorans TaxID=408753 RepID=UPI00047E7D5A|nr:protease complex subunit PrcB family protein [Clostridiisalibacter paucivorans]